MHRGRRLTYVRLCTVGVKNGSCIKHARVRNFGGIKTFVASPLPSDLQDAAKAISHWSWRFPFIIARIHHGVAGSPLGGLDERTAPSQTRNGLKSYAQIRSPSEMPPLPAKDIASQVPTSPRFLRNSFHP